MNILRTFIEARNKRSKLLAILIDPDKFDLDNTPNFLRSLPNDVSHIFIGGSTVKEGDAQNLVKAIKLATSKPVILFPGDTSQISNEADALLFLSLLSGRNSEYLVGQQIKAIPHLRGTQLEIISTGYILVDGGNVSAVQRVTNTSPMPQEDVQKIVDTAKAGELIGNKLVYLEAGSGASVPVSEEIIKAVKNEITIPLIVGGGIRTENAKQIAYKAGADMVVMGTAFEEQK